MLNYEQFIKEIEDKISQVIKSNSFILGTEVQRFEKKIANFFNTKHAIGVNSGTAALIHALKPLELKANDEVICPAFSFIATAEVIIRSGARPIFADINPKNFNIDPYSLKKQISKNTKAIIPVHLFGQMANISEINKIAQIQNIKIIEDAAQSFGALYDGKKAGTLGYAACLSFFPTKILGAFGDGGMIITNNDSLAKTARMMRAHGINKRQDLYYDHKIIGSASRLDEIQAAILLVKLKYINENLKHRCNIAKLYNNMLQNVGDIILPHIDKNAKHVFEAYVIKTQYQKELKNFLAENGFETYIHYPIPLHYFKVFKYLGYNKGDFPIAEQTAKQVLSLPINEFLSLDKIIEISKLIKKFFTINS